MAKAFPGSGPDIDARYERAGKWLLATILERKDARDWCDKKGVAVVKAQSEGIGSGGGFLVPLELENAILDLRDTFGALRRRACKWPMGSDSSLFPRRTGGTSAYFIAEGAPASTSTINMDSVNLTAKKLGALVTMSSELNEDSVVDLVDYIATEIAWALAATEDDCAFNGDGTATYGKIRGIGPSAIDGGHGKAKVSAAAGHNTYALIDATDLGNLLAGVRASAMPRAAWYVSSVGFALTFARIAAATGGLLTPGLVDGVPTQFYNGFPVIPVQKMSQQATAFSTGQMMMAFGDMYAAAVLGQRRGLTIARSEHRYLENDQLAILATERFDAVVHDMGDNANLGSLAVLVSP
jgi:HK97 family phage major capsid protein